MRLSPNSVYSNSCVTSANGVVFWDMSELIFAKPASVSLSSSVQPSCATQAVCVQRQDGLDGRGGRWGRGGRAEEERDELDSKMKEAKVEEEKLKEELEKVELRMERFEDFAWDWDRQELEKARKVDAVLYQWD